MSGLAGSEFIVEDGTGQPYLLELSRRITPGTHRGRALGVDLCAALRARIDGVACASRTGLDDGEEGMYALFPQEWLRDPSSSPSIRPSAWTHCPTSSPSPGAEPGKIAYSTGGVGSTGHLAAEMLSSAAHIQLLHVPYPSANLVMRDVVSGLVPLTFNPLSATTPYIRDKRLTALAVTGSRRVQRFPEVPTVAELGFPGFDVSSWYGIVAPLATSPEIVDRLQREFVAVLALPEMRARLVEMGMEIVANTSRAAISTCWCRWERRSGPRLNFGRSSHAPIFT